MKRLKIIGLVGLLVVIAYIVVNFSRSPSSRKQLVKVKNAKYILYWNGMFGRDDFYLGEGHISRHCPHYNNCYSTSNRNSLNQDEYDAIIFHGINDEFHVNDLPEKRSQGQKYIFFSAESPFNRHLPNPRVFDHFYNLTMTYHSDSDIVKSYADVVEIQTNRVMFPSKSPHEWIKPNNSQFFNNFDENLDKVIKRKKKAGIWYRSNCEGRSGREEFAEELSKHISISNYGGCSKEEYSGCKTGDCLKTEVEPDYFFYLSLENSLCTDYVTEKLFKVLNHHIVPVVYGGADYKKIVPPNSYINALDYESPRHLADYLKYLMNNMDEYKKYFWWKKYYRVVLDTSRVICDLCEVVNGNGTKTWNKLSQWYSENQCDLNMKLRIQKHKLGVGYATKFTINQS